MLEEILEINIPTYNRASLLNKTLSKLLNSPFKKCTITIIDNCSPDNTPEICEKYKKLFPNLTIIRNSANIGGNANIMHCYERGKKMYNWVLGDNDELNFSNCKDLIEQIESKKFDLLITCSPEFPFNGWKNITEALKEKNSNKENYLETNSKTLFNILNIGFFNTLGFISSAIYKSELYDSDCLIKGYHNIYNIYPHYPFAVKALNENFSIYKSQNDIINIKENEDTQISGSSLYWLKGWLNSNCLIEDKKVRDIVLSRFNETKYLIVLAIACVIIDKANDIDQIQFKIVDLCGAIFKSKGFIKGLFYSILIELSSLIPKSVCKKIYAHQQKNKKN